MIAAIKQYAALNVAAVKTIGEWIGLYIGALKKCAVFAGRASRREFFAFIVVAVVIDLIVLEVAHALAPDTFIIADLFALAMFLPAVSITFRRLHDFGSSGWGAAFIYAPAPFMYAVYASIFYHPELPDSIFSAEIFEYLVEHHSWLGYVLENAWLFYSIVFFLVFHFLISVCIYLRLFLRDGDKGANKYGEEPKAAPQGA